LAIAPNIAEKMAKDPAFAAKYEQVIADVPKSTEEMKSRIAGLGGENLACGVSIDKNGKVSYWSVSRYHRDTRQGTDYKKILQEQLEEKRAKKKEEEALKEKKLAKAESVEKLITPRTKGIVAVDFTGQSVEHDALRAICEKYGLLLIEDAAHAIGTKYKGKPIGGIADMTCFSFHPVKTVTAGEGGAITTNDEGLYRKLMRVRTHGITRNQDEMVHPTDAAWYNEQVELGYNYRMTDFQAALLLNQIKKLPAFSARRKEIVKMYDRAFEDMPEILIQREIPESDTTRHLYIIRLELSRLRCDRRQFFDALYAENTCPQVHYLPVYWHSYYEKLGYERGLCPNAEKYYQEVMSIPLYYSLTDEDAADVIRAVRKVTAYYSQSEEK